MNRHFLSALRSTLYALRSTPYAACLFLCVLSCGCQNKQLYQDNRVMMGTFVEVISPDKQAADIVFQEIKRMESILSKYNPDSEIAKLNRAGEVTAGPDTFYILEKAYYFWQVSDGAFDVTVGPLVNLWGFSDKKYYLPDRAEIKKTLGLVGSDKISFDNSNNMVKLKLSGMKIDLGGIAKGYALDCAVKKLTANNIKSCLINLGGQIYCLGNRFGRPWRIAIQAARNSGTREIIELKNLGISTSGDYEQYFIIDNKRYCHILNPKTGCPAESGIKSVTVIAPSNLEADALSTAIFILGKTSGEALAKKFPQVQVKIYE